MTTEPALSVVQSDAKHKTTPIKSSLTPVPNYPAKLVIYRLAASPFWWVRYYADGKILRRTTKETDKRRAIEFAKAFYDEINFKQRQGMVLNSKADFEVCANELLESQDSKVKRGEMSAMMQQNDRYRLAKMVLPFFRDYDLKHIDYFVLEQFLSKLGDEKLTPPTISNYMGLVRKTLNHAQRKGFIQAVPQFPKVARKDTPRGWFTLREYRKLWCCAKRLRGKTYEIRKSGEATFVCERQPAEPTAKHAEQIAESELLRRVAMTEDLYQLIVFMTNSFIRPTDIKWMQHKHVAIIDGDNVYLRLSIPTSKKHDKPIVTMRNAVDYYKRLRAYYEPQGLANADDYVFMPQFGEKRRDAALTQLQRQFSVVLADTKLENGPRGEERSLYSLRHTCIMYRLLYGEGLDLLTLARNARTSSEMIDRFYASHLEGEMNIVALQSKRKRIKRLTLAIQAEAAKPPANEDRNGRDND